MMAIPADLLVALAPMLLVACLWLKELLVRHFREPRARMARRWHEGPSGRRIGRPA